MRKTPYDNMDKNRTSITVNKLDFENKFSNNKTRTKILNLLNKKISIKKVVGKTTTTTTNMLMESSLAIKTLNESSCKNFADGEMVSDPIDCNWFYTCENGKMTNRRKCNNNLRFDPKTKVCNWPDQVLSVFSNFESN
jgi:hypothetical protein